MKFINLNEDKTFKIIIPKNLLKCLTFDFDFVFLIKNSNVSLKVKTFSVPMLNMFFPFNLKDFSVILNKSRADKNCILFSPFPRTHKVALSFRNSNNIPSL